MKSMIHPILRVSRQATLPINSFFSQRLVYTVKNFKDCVAKVDGQLSEDVIKEKLKTLSVNFTDGFTCLHLNCNLCSKKKTNSPSPILYLNKKTGFFLCDKCKVSGGWLTFLKNVENKGMKNPVDKPFEKNHLFNEYEENWKSIIKQCTSLSDLDDCDYFTTLEKFRLNSNQRSEINVLNARVNKDFTTLYIPLYSNNTVVGYKIIDSDGKSITYPSVECAGFISTKKKAKTAVVVAEIQDFLSLSSQNLEMEILCLPYGTSVLPQSCLPFLEHYEKIILWLGGIEALDITVNFANKLNNKRCFMVKPINDQKSAHYAVANKKNILDILLNSKATWHESIITFHALRDEVLAQLQNKEQCAGVQWKRFPSLNYILKGHRRGELTILTGPTGSGKTTFISEYSLDLATQGVNTLWGSFEIKNSHLAKKMLQQYCRMPLEENLDKFNKLADKFEQLPIFFLSFHGPQELASVLEAVEHSSYVYDIAHVIIDNVQFMIDIEPDNSKFDRFFKQDVLIQKFRKFATEHNCHVTLVMHPRKGMQDSDLSANSIFGGVKATQEADNILIIQNKKFNSLITRKMLQIEKNRYSGDLGTMNLDFDKASYCFSPNLNVDKSLKLFKQNLELEVKNEKYFGRPETVEEVNCYHKYEEVEPQTITKMNRQLE